jgi:hypothetical protein
VQLAAKSSRSDRNDPSLSAKCRSANMPGRYSIIRAPSRERKPKQKVERAPETTEDERSASERMADEMVVTIRGRPTIAALERFRAIDAVKRDFDLLDEEDKARVDEADTTRRAEIEAGASNLIAG